MNLDDIREEVIRNLYSITRDALEARETKIALPAAKLLLGTIHDIRAEQLREAERESAEAVRYDAEALKEETRQLKELIDALRSPAN